MSHFTRIRTQMVEREYLLQALRDTGYTPEVGSIEMRGFGNERASVEVSIRLGWLGRQVGFRKKDAIYEVVADWWGAPAVKREEFLNKLTQRYAYCATRAKLEEQGFLETLDLPLDEVALADAIKTTLETPRELGEVRDFVRGNFSWERVVDRLMQVFNEMLEG